MFEGDNTVYDIDIKPRTATKEGTKEDFRNATDLVIKHAQKENDVYRVEASEKNILSNWAVVKARLEKKDGVVGSSTEGHLSHVLASRMISRPLG